MNPNQFRRAPRHYFGGPAELTDTASCRKVLAQTTDLNLFGCFVKTTTPFSPGTSIKLRITHALIVFEAEGTVVHAQPDGMGIVFDWIALADQLVLDHWLSETEERHWIVH